MAMQMSKVIGCTVTECAYNKNNECHTLGITVGSPGHPCCDTFYRSKARGGAPDIHGGVGACRADDCRFNSNLECTAQGINVGSHQGHADCKTFAAR